MRGLAIVVFVGRLSGAMQRAYMLQAASCNIQSLERGGCRSSERQAKAPVYSDGSVVMRVRTSAPISHIAG